MDKFQIILLSFVLSLINPFGVQARAHNLQKEGFTIAVFPQKSARYLYRAKINFRGKEITGLLLIRKKPEGSYRIALVTEMGLKLFEMGFYPNKKKPFVLYSCIKYMNKKVIISTLRKDFESIFLNFSAWKKPKIHQKGNQYKYRYCYQGKRLYFCNKYGDLSKIIRKRWGFKQEIIKIKNSKNPYPQEIAIEHQHITLSIVLTFIK